MTPYVRASRRQQIFNFDPRLVYNGESFDPNTAVAALEQFLALFNPPTAVLAANNFIAIGFIRAVRKHGMDIPTHFALTCFEKIEPIDLVTSASLKPCRSLPPGRTRVPFGRLILSGAPRRSAKSANATRYV